MVFLELNLIFINNRNLLHFSVLVMATVIHPSVQGTFFLPLFYLFCIFHQVLNSVAYVHNIFLSFVPFCSLPWPLSYTWLSPFLSWNCAIVWLPSQCWPFSHHTLQCHLSNDKSGHGILYSNNIYGNSDATKSFSNKARHSWTMATVFTQWIIHYFLFLNTFAQMALTF